MYRHAVADTTSSSLSPWFAKSEILNATVVLMSAQSDMMKLILGHHILVAREKTIKPRGDRKNVLILKKGNRSGLNVMLSICRNVTHYYQRSKSVTVRKINKTEGGWEGGDPIHKFIICPLY